MASNPAILAECHQNGLLPAAERQPGHSALLFPKGGGGDNFHANHVYTVLNLETMGRWKVLGSSQNDACLEPNKMTPDVECD